MGGLNPFTVERFSFPEPVVYEKGWVENMMVVSPVQADVSGNWNSECPIVVGGEWMGWKQRKIGVFMKERIL